MHVGNGEVNLCRRKTLEEKDTEWATANGENLELPLENFVEPGHLARVGNKRRVSSAALPWRFAKMSGMGYVGSSPFRGWRPLVARRRRECWIYEPGPRILPPSNWWPCQNLTPP